MSHPPTAPAWIERLPSENRRLVLSLVVFMLYAGLMVLAFYVGVCWMQTALGQLTLSVQELKNEIQNMHRG